MLNPLAVLTAAALTAATHTDTTFAVRPGARLEINTFSGDISVRTWSRNAIHIEADHSSRTYVQIRSDDPTIELVGVHRHGLPTTVDYQITVPRWMALKLSGVGTDISVTATEGDVEASSVQGDVSVTGAARSVKASSVEGDVEVDGARGKVEVSSVNSGVHVSHISGEVTASSVNGEIKLEDIESSDVEGSTINGTVTYEGSIREDGSYHFSSHDGTVTIALPDKVNASVSVSTFNGSFSSDFPVKSNETKHGKRFNFTLGNGSARIELESFQGEIELRRQGSPGYKYQYDDGKKDKDKDQKKKGDRDDDHNGEDGDR
jgi:DUF4097 and DUF4098 domain-containing protein YvlB